MAGGFMGHARGRITRRRSHPCLPLIERTTVPVTAYGFRASRDHGLGALAGRSTPIARGADECAFLCHSPHRLSGGDWMLANRRRAPRQVATRAAVSVS
jgi:hypothetical protein